VIVVTREAGIVRQIDCQLPIADWQLEGWRLLKIGNWQAAIGNIAKLSLTLSKASCILLLTSYLLSRINGDCACP
jgi:hypothetical protein